MPRLKKKEEPTQQETKLPAVELAKTKRAELVQLELTSYTSEQIREKLQAAVIDLHLNETLASLKSLVDNVPTAPEGAPKELVVFLKTIKENITIHCNKIQLCYDRAITLIAEGLTDGAAQIPSNIYNIRDALRTLAESLDSADGTVFYSACRHFQADIGRTSGHTCYYTKEDLDHVCAEAEEKGYERGLKNSSRGESYMDLPDID